MPLDRNMAAGVVVAIATFVLLCVGLPPALSALWRVDLSYGAYAVAVSCSAITTVGTIACIRHVTAWWDEINLR